MNIKIGDKVTFQRKPVYSVGNYAPSEKVTTRSITGIHSESERPSGTKWWRVTLSDGQERYLFLNVNEDGNLIGWAEGCGAKESRWWLVQVNEQPMHF